MPSSLSQPGIPITVPCNSSLLCHKTSSLTRSLPQPGLRHCPDHLHLLLCLHLEIFETSIFVAYKSQEETQGRNHEKLKTWDQDGQRKGFSASAQKASGQSHLWNWRDYSSMDSHTYQFPLIPKFILQVSPPLWWRLPHLPVCKNISFLGQ